MCRPPESKMRHEPGRKMRYEPLECLSLAAHVMLYLEPIRAKGDVPPRVPG